MTKLQYLKNFLNETQDFNDFAFHCSTLEEAEELVQLLYELGYYWFPNSEYSKDEVYKRWNQKKKNTCIVIGSQNIPDKNILFNGRMGMYVNQGRAIVEMEDFFNEIESTSSFVTSNDKKITESEIDNATYKDTKKCPKCNTEIPKEAKFCRICGNKFNTQDTVTIETEDYVENKNDIKGKTELKQNIIDDSENKNSVLDFINKGKINKNTNTETEKESKKTGVEHVSSIIDNQNNSEENSNNSKSGTDKEEETYPILLNEQENEPKTPIICKLLGVEVNQKFKISNSFYDKSNNIFRINKEGYREVLVGKNLWFISNNEQELAFLIQNSKQIIKCS